MELVNPVLAMASGEHEHAHEAATHSEPDNPLILADGSLLYVSKAGTMRMVDKTGKPMAMKEGVEMVLEDGSTILMHNKKIFRHIHKGRP